MWVLKYSKYPVHFVLSFIISLSFLFLLHFLLSLPHHFKLKNEEQQKKKRKKNLKRLIQKTTQHTPFEKSPPPPPPVVSNGCVNWTSRSQPMHPFETTGEGVEFYLESVRPSPRPPRSPPAPVPHPFDIYKPIRMRDANQMSRRRYRQYVILKSMKQKLGMIRRVKHLFTSAQHSTLYWGFVMPHAICSTVWSSKSEGNYNTINKLHKRAAYIVIGSTWQIPSDQVMRGARSRVENSKRNVRQIHCMYMMYKCVSGIAPQILSDIGSAWMMIYLYDTHEVQIEIY